MCEHENNGGVVSPPPELEELRDRGPHMWDSCEEDAQPRCKSGSADERPEVHTGCAGEGKSGVTRATPVGERQDKPKRPRLEVLRDRGPHMWDSRGEDAQPRCKAGSVDEQPEVHTGRAGKGKSGVTRATPVGERQDKPKRPRRV